MISQSEILSLSQVSVINNISGSKVRRMLSKSIVLLTTLLAFKFIILSFVLVVQTAPCSRTSGRGRERAFPCAGRQAGF